MNRDIEKPPLFLDQTFLRKLEIKLNSEHSLFLLMCHYWKVQRQRGKIT